MRARALRCVTRGAALALGAWLLGVQSAAAAPAFTVRPFRAQLGQRWIGNAIAYGPHRDGQSPGGAPPTRAQIAEDLTLMAPHWRLLRTYNSTGAADSLFPVLAASRTPMRVLLGVWIGAEDRRDSTGAVVEEFAAMRAANRREVDAAVRLARRYPRLIAGLCVGNETQVAWSGNRVPQQTLVRYIRELRARTTLPVTTGDDIQYWRLPASRALSRELDFVSVHLHAHWGGQTLESAVGWIAANYDSVRTLHAGRPVVIGETGWATDKLATGDQGTYMKSPAGEAEQAAFTRAASAWVARRHVVTFFFEAFDENWKGGPDPHDAEKHWGFFRADRTPKPVLTLEN